MAAVQAPAIPLVADLIRANPGTISLGQGVVGYGPPPQAIDRIRDFLADPQNHKYQAVHGIPPLLAGLQKKLCDENGVEIGPERALVVTAGGNMAFMNAVLAIVDPGDEVIITTPYYFNHEMAIRIADARPVTVPTDEHYQLRLDALEAAITPRTRALVTISPNNPTGAVYAEDRLRAVNELCRRRRIYHISDEAYECFTWDGTAHFSPASIPGSEGHTLGLYSFSKSHGLASWRIGYMVVPRPLFEPIRKIQDTNLICPPVISQWAAVGGAGGRAGILPQPNGGDGCCTASGPCGIERCGRRVQRAGGVRGLLRPAERRGPHRIDAACGTPGAGTPRGGDARLDVRCCRSLCAAGVLRPARSRHGPRGHRAARLRSAPILKG